MARKPTGTQLQLPLSSSEERVIDGERGNSMIVSLFPPIPKEEAPIVVVGQARPFARMFPDIQEALDSVGKAANQWLRDHATQMYAPHAAYVSFTVTQAKFDRENGEAQYIATATAHYYLRVAKEKSEKSAGEPAPEAE